MTKIVVVYEHDDGQVESISGYGTIMIERRQDRVDFTAFDMYERHYLPGVQRLTTTIEWQQAEGHPAPNQIV